MINSIMIKNQRLLSFIFSIQWRYWLQIEALLILLALPFFFLFLSPRAIHADERLSIDGGLGNFQIKAKHDQFQSDSKNTRRHISLGMDLEKDEYPLRISFQGTFFVTDEESEKWTSNTPHENRLNIHGVTMDVLAYVTPYTFSPSEVAFRIKPFIGGGLVYRRFKLERKGLKGSMIPLTTNVQYYLGNQSIIAIGAMPHIGFFLEIPKFEVECRLSLGWSFLAVKSNINYQAVFSGNDEIRYPFHIHSSGSSIVTGMQIVKRWESFSVALGFLWEKTQIDDKSSFFYTSSGTTDVYLPFPEFEIIQTIGQISLKYLF